MAIIDTLNQKTGQDAREYSKSFDDFSGLPSVVQQVGDVEKSRRFPKLRIPSVNEIAQQNVNHMFSAGNPVEEYQMPDNMKYSEEDEKFRGYQDALQKEDIRAAQQSGIEQLVNGVSKGVVIAGTTFLDGIVGTAAGIVNLAWQASKGDIERPADALYAFIDNPVSRQLQKVNEWAEKVMPNYYSEEQRNAKWYEPVNLFSANFVGDKFLKNTGFMIGAAYSGRVNAGAMSKVLAKKELRDAFKGVVKNAAGKELRTAGEIYKAYKTGDAFMDGVKLTEDLAKQAKQIRNQEWGLKMLGAVTSAAGEARIEAITNTEDWAKRMQKLIDDDKQKAIAMVHNDILAQSTNENPTYTLQYDRESGQYVPVYTDLGQNLANEKLADIEQQYQDANIQLQKDRAVMANQIFGLNMFILTGSNLYTFGRFISGGYKTGSKAGGLTKGAIRKGYEKANTERLKNIGKAAMVPVVEGPYEEMMQAAAATGAGYHASAKMNEFYGYKIDEDAQKDAVNTANAILEGIRDTYSDVDKWEEGLIGALSSIVGLPSFVEVRDENGITQYEEYQDKKGNTKYKPKRKFKWQGEFWDSIADAKEANKKSQEVTDELNKIIQRKDFLNYWQSWIRHRALDQLKTDALNSGNVFEYKNLDSNQIVSDIRAFDKAGRLQDLFDLVDESINISLDDYKAIIESSTDKEGNSPFDGMRPEDVIGTVKEHAQDFKNRLDKYVEIKDDLRTVYGRDINEDYLDALTWGYMSIDDSENRIKQISDELIPKLNDIFYTFSALSGKELGINVENLKDLYRFALDEEARKKFLNVIGRKSARFADMKAILPEVEKILKQKDEILTYLEIAKDLNDKESTEKFESLHKSALDTYLSALKMVDLIEANPGMRSISDAEMSLVHRDMNDLGNILTYRSQFLDMLATLTSDPGAFDKSVIALDKKMIDKRDKDEAQKLYDSIPEDMDQKAFNNFLLKIKNQNQYALLNDMVKKSPNANIKSLYKNFEELMNAINALGAVSVDPEDPLRGLKSAFINGLSEKIEAVLPGSKEELVDYINQQVQEIGLEEAADFANELVSIINTNQGAAQDVDDIIEGNGPAQKVKEPEKKKEKKEKKKEEKKPEPEEQTRKPYFDDYGDVNEEYEQTPKEKATTGGEIDENENYRVVEEAIQKLSAAELIDIVDNLVVPESINGKIPIAQLVQMARYYLDENDVGDIDDAINTINDAKDKSEKENALPERITPGGQRSYEYADGTVLEGVSITKYDIGGIINDMDLRRYNSGNSIIVADILDQDFNAYNFLESGALAAIEKYNISQGTRTQIKFVFANKNEGAKYADKLHSTSTTKSGFERDLYNILLAFEMTPELNSQLTKDQQDTVKTVNIGGKEYQIIGCLNSLNDSEDSKNAYYRIYSAAITSIDRQREDPETMGQDLFIGDFNGEPLQTVIAKIYTGRLLKIAPNAKYESMKNLVNTPMQKNIRYGVAVKSKRDGITYIFTDDDSKPIKRPEELGIPAVPGMVYAFITAPDGSISYVPLVMSRSSEINWSADTPFVRDIHRNVDILLDEKASYDDKLDAKYKIAGAFAQRVQFYFRPDSPNSFVLAGTTVKSWDDFVKVISAERNQLRVQFSRHTPRNPELIKEMIDSDLIHARYQSLRHFNPSFLVMSLDAQTAKTRDIQPHDIDEVRDHPYTDVQKYVIQYGNKQYNFNDENQIVDENGELVDDELSRRLLVQFSVAYLNDEEDMGLTITREIGTHNILYTIEGAPDGSTSTFYMARNVKSKVVKEISKDDAEFISNQIKKEIALANAKKAAQDVIDNDLDVIHDDKKVVPQTTQGLKKEDVVQEAPIEDTHPAPEEKPEKKSKKKKRAPVTRGNVEVDFGSRELTDEDKALIPLVKEVGTEKIQQWLEARGISTRVDIRLLNDALAAQLLNQIFEENKDNANINQEQMESDLQCGRHGRK